MMSASIVRTQPRDPYQRLSLAVLRQSLVDARAGERIDIEQLQPWADLAGIPAENLHGAFYRLRAGDTATLMLVSRLARIKRGHLV